MTSITAALSAPFTAAGSTVRILGQRLLFGVSRSWGVYLSRTRIDYRSEIGDPATNSVVGAVVGWIARNLPEAPIRIVKEDTTELAYGPAATGPGAMLRLLKNPNPYYSGQLQWRATLVDYYCRGNAYWLKQRAPSGRVTALWWIPERMLEPRWPDSDPSVFIGWYEYKVDGETWAVDPRDVVHFRNGIDPNNTRKGLSGLASLFREIFTDDEASNFSASLLRNLGVPGVVISPSNTGGPVGRADPEAVKTSFMEKFGGDKRGEPLVLTAPTDVKVLSFNPQQMELRELRRIPEERISANLGVPASVAGLGAGLDQNAFTSYGEANVAAYTQGVIPTQGELASTLDTQLLPDFAGAEADNLDVWFDWTNVAAMSAAAAAIWKRYESTATKGLSTRADFKRATGQTVTPEDEIYIIPNNYIFVGTGGSTPPSTVPLVTQPPSQRRASDVTRSEAVFVTAPEIRCSGSFRGEPCGKLLGLATAPYELKCDRCKSIAAA